MHAHSMWSATEERLHCDILQEWVDTMDFFPAVQEALHKLASFSHYWNKIQEFWCKFSSGSSSSKSCGYPAKCLRQRQTQKKKNGTASQTSTQVCAPEGGGGGRCLNPSMNLSNKWWVLYYIPVKGTGIRGLDRDHYSGSLTSARAKHLHHVTHAGTYPLPSIPQ